MQNENNSVQAKTMEQGEREKIKRNERSHGISRAKGLLRFMSQQAQDSQLINHKRKYELRSIVNPEPRHCDTTHKSVQHPAYTIRNGNISSVYFHWTVFTRRSAA